MLGGSYEYGARTDQPYSIIYASHASPSLMPVSGSTREGKLLTVVAIDVHLIESPRQAKIMIMKTKK